MAKILIVEDDKILGELLSKGLSKEKHVTELSHTGEAALDLLRVYKFDLVILDWTLPGITGMDVCRQLRDRDTVTPVLMLTSRSSIEAKEEGLNAGADDYLTKPFHPRE